MKFTRIPIRTLPSGNEVFIPIYFFKGKTPKAKKAYLQSSIHGAEHQGNTLIHHLIEFLKKNPPLGDVTLVPICNPVGLDHKSGEYTDGRYETATGENWNRAYLVPNLDYLKGRHSVSELKTEMLKPIRKKLKSRLRFAEKLALTLQEMAMQADIVLDLHNANVSLPYVYAAESTLKDAVYLGFQHIISIPAVFGGSLDEAISAPWMKLQKIHALKENEVPQGYTIELGGQERISMDAGKVECANVIEFLKHQGIISGKAKRPASCFVCDLADYQTIYAPRGGLYDYKTKTGVVIKKGTVMAECLNFSKSGGVVTEVRAEEDLIATLHYSSSSVSEGDELFKVFSKWRSISTK
jgi:predicted deacylase